MRDQPQARARLAHVAHRVLVARAVEHHDHHVADVLAAALGDQAQRLPQRPVEVEQVGDVVAAGDLLHVDARARVEHRAALRQRDHRQRVGLSLGGQRRALERIDRHVDLGRRAVADALAVVEHRRLVLLALADHDGAVHLHAVEHEPHRVDRGLVGALLVAHADEPRRGERRGLGRAHELEGQVAVRPVVASASSAIRSFRVACARARRRSSAARTRRTSASSPSSATKIPERRWTRLLGSPGLGDERVVGDQAERGDRDDRGHLAARPRQRVVAHDDPGEDERRQPGEQEQPAQDVVRVPAAEVAVVPLSARARRRGTRAGTG